MRENSFQFDSEHHIYSLSKKRIPSVTGVLQSCRLSRDLSCVPAQTLYNKRELGRALHKALHYLQEGDLDRDSLIPELAICVQAYEQFAKDVRFMPGRIEEPTFGKLAGLRYGMTPDCSGMVDGQPAVIDFKMADGAPDPAWALQLAAYANGLPVPMISPFKYRRFTVQLKSNGKYRHFEHSDDGDLEDFRIALQFTYMRIKRGMEAF